MNDSGESRLQAWRNAARLYLDRRVLTIGLLGFSSGLPLLLVFSTLSYWLKDAGVSLAAIGLFSLVRTPYGFKFIWAPLMDRLPLPGMTRWFGRRRGWALTTQVLLILSIVALAVSNPAMTPELTALFAVFVAFCSASQDIVIDALRIELLEDDEQGAGSAMIVLGYRIGMLTSGAGALWMASALPWQTVYLIMAACISVGVLAILLAREPVVDEKAEALFREEDEARVRARFPRMAERMVHILAFLQTSVIRPFSNFTKRPGWLLVLLFIFLYKLSDTYLGAMVNPFYVEVGFSKEEIAGVIKIFGMGATLLGGLVGGLLVKRYGILKTLMLGAFLQGASNLMYTAQAVIGDDVGFLMATISVENISGGIGTTAFVAYMSSLCSVAYTATQYALLSSLMGLSRDVMSSTSGWLAEAVSWPVFFSISALAALPALVVLIFMMRHFSGAGAVQTEDAPES